MTYPDAEFGSWVDETLVAAKVNAKEAEAEMKKYGVVWTPWLLLLDENGEQVSWNVGPLSPADYRGWLDRAITDRQSFLDTLKMMAVSPDNADMNMILGRHYLEAGNWAKAIEHLTVAMKGMGPAKAVACTDVCVSLGKAAARKGDDAALAAAIDCLGKCGKGGEAAVALEKVHAKLAAGEFEEAAKGYDSFLKEHGTEACAPEAWYWWGVARYLPEHKPDGLMEAWNKLIETAPDNEWARRAAMSLGK